VTYFEEKKKQTQKHKKFTEVELLGLPQWKQVFFQD
jgi:hypothetical protein